MTELTIGPVALDTVLDIRHAVLWPDKPRDFVSVTGDEMALHLGAELRGRVVCVVSLYDTDTGARMRKFATLPTFQGRGIGAQVLTEVLVRTAQTHRRIWMSARLDALTLYRRFGFVEFGTPFERSGQSYCYLERPLPLALEG
ncbi:MAG: GNAT family N-acetyltransferase [Pelagimonas sp.]|uniref:GNAT family N-acetyltransferase n=1 Tax=Pelagimonas sp. TaxID=2073170 RepID=UPI003D6B3A19